jgi:hypothetical protein
VVHTSFYTKEPRQLNLAPSFLTAFADWVYHNDSCQIVTVAHPACILGMAAVQSCEPDVANN